VQCDDVKIQLYSTALVNFTTLDIQATVVEHQCRVASPYYGNVIALHNTPRRATRSWAAAAPTGLDLTHILAYGNSDPRKYGPENCRKHSAASGPESDTWTEHWYTCCNACQQQN